MKKRFVIALLIGCAVTVPTAQRTGSTPFPLTVDSIMRGPELVGYPPTDLRWSGDSKELYFEWRMPGDDESATWRVGRDGGQPQRLSDEERRLAPLANGAWDADRRRIVGVDRDDVVVIDTITRSRIAVTRTTDAESAPRWARNGTHVTFVRDDNLFIAPFDSPGGRPFDSTAGRGAPGGLAQGALVQLTDVVTKRSDPQTTDSQKVVKQEERELLQWVEEQAARRQRREARERANRPPRFEIAERERIADAALSADETFAYLLVAERAQARNTNVPRYVSESGYAEEIPSRTKVGDAQERRRLAILNLRTGEGVWAGLDGISDPVRIPKPAVDPSGASATEAAGEDKGSDSRDRQDPPKRPVRWSALLLSPDGQRAVASVRSLDNNNRWVVLVDPASGKTTILDVVHDDAWVREIGASNNISGGVGWLPDSSHVWFLAEHDGWMHLYTVDTRAERPEPRQLTTGKFEIDSVELSRDGSTFYFRSTEVHPGERHLYAMKVGGGPRTRLSSMTGAHAGAIAPDDSTFGVVYSSANKPPEVLLMPNRPGAEAIQVTTSTSAEWRQHEWVEPQLVTYQARDGAVVHARLYTPEMVGARRNPQSPAVIFVHGAGYLQNAHRYWSSYYREYMFHHLLASRGYVVLDPDYRASAGYGRDWRTAIYRWMGGKDLEDVLDGAKYLTSAHKVSAQRIGVYGGSYGGFITLMAMFTSPDTFAAGAALRPVTDWAHYNHPYTSNILNEPQADAEAYRKSSPIYFADRLKGALLICHGMVDTNVHFQDSVRLVQRLIELGKENWELAVYPVENHGFVEETSWADEYKRILKLFERNLGSTRGTN